MCMPGMFGGGGGGGSYPSINTGMPMPQAAPQTGPAQAGSPLLQDTGGAVRQDQQPLPQNAGALFMRRGFRAGEGAGREGDPGISGGNLDSNPGGARGGIY